LRRALRAGRQVLRPERPLVTHPARTAIGAGACVDSSARLVVLDAEHAPEICITLGDNVYLGRQVEITAAGGGTVLIGADTSFQDGDIIYGDVRIGAHCLFGRQVFVASRGHNFRHQPTWLIRDQDAAVLANPPNAGSRTVIEDDCWIAQNVVVMPGVYVGRGAVLGANCVVTRDVGPYEVHGGAPNRKIGSRLDFSPPARINASEDDHLPYFYRGFALSQAALAASRMQRAIKANRKACLVLAGADGGQLEVRGHLADGALRLRVNGAAQAMEAKGDFVIHADVPPATDARPVPLQGHTIIELAADGEFSITTASIT
jgi:acetyltransferase-like isoleucine patch superfamily enzyme